jgi:hypothetical protein
MAVDLHAARAHQVAHARLLDRRRFELLVGDAGPGPALTALEPYRNPDGGYGSGLEPDLRDRRSQPVAAMHAFEVFEEAAPLTRPEAAGLCDWLAGATLPGGGLPFAVPVSDPGGSAPFWTGADPHVPSLHITCAVVAFAVRVARHDAAVAAHPWLADTVRWALDRIAAAPEPASTLELLYALGFLDALGADHPEAPALVERLAAHIPPSGSLAVEGGAPDERVGPLLLAPRPDSLVRRRLTESAVDADLDRLAAAQTAEGGWEVDFRAWSPAAALEWNGYETVRAVRVLRDNGRLPT